MSLAGEVKFDVSVKYTLGVTGFNRFVEVEGKQFVGSRGVEASGSHKGSGDDLVFKFHVFFRFCDKGCIISSKFLYFKSLRDNSVVRFSIKNWALWTASPIVREGGAGLPIFSGSPDVSAVSPMVRRRMPLLAKVIFFLNQQLELPAVDTVYATQNAELSRTLKLLRQFDGDVSPAMFSMSVNNAIAGLLSVINADSSVYSVVDSMSGLLEMAVLEAVTWLPKSEHGLVKVVLFEEASCEPLRQGFDLDQQATVLVLLLETGQDVSLSMLDGEADERLRFGTWSAADYLGFLSGSSSCLISRENRVRWQWQRR